MTFDMIFGAMCLALVLVCLLLPCALWITFRPILSRVREAEFRKNEDGSIRSQFELEPEEPVTGLWWKIKAFIFADRK